MSGPDAATRSLDSALLVLSRSPQALAALLRAALPPGVLAELARAAGRRRAGAREPAEVLVDAVVQMPRHRRIVAGRLASALPEDDAPSWEAVAGPDARFLRREALLARLRTVLCAGDPDGWARAAAFLHEWQAWLPAAPEPERAARASPAADREEAAGAPARAPAEAVRHQLDSLERRLRDAGKEVERLQDELGRERKRRLQVQEELAEWRASADEARRKAAETKRRLAKATAPSERERLLQSELRAFQHQVDVLQQKLRILEEERGDLHAVLEDHDRFQALQPEEVPSFRDRPLQPEERELAARLAARRDGGRRPLRVLVVGGGEPQCRHREKLAEYAEVVGFRAEWRMAEYTAWHKELERLEADMARHFDALVILHWNRTTFTWKAREICNRVGQKPCRTCHYEGFTSLRRALQDALGQLLAAEEARGSVP